MSNPYGEKDEINQETVPLEPFLLANILAKYLRCEPENVPLMLPNFRLLQLAKGVSQSVKNDGDVIFAVGCLYAICMHCSMASYFYDESIHLLSSILQTALTESLAVIQKMGTCQVEFVHASTFFSQEPIHDSSQITFDTFQTSLSISRDILRDMIPQVRNVNDAKKTEVPKGKTAQKPPSDCFQSHSIFFMCSFAIANLATSLNLANNMNAVPGVVETLALMTLILPREKTQNEKMVEEQVKKATQHTKSSKEFNRYYHCLQQSNRLGYLVMNSSIKERTLQEIRVARSKYTKNIANSEVAYAKAMALMVRDFLDPKNTTLPGYSGNSNTAPTDVLISKSLRINVNDLTELGSLIPTWATDNPSELSGSDGDKFDSLSKHINDVPQKKIRVEVALANMTPNSKEARFYWKLQPTMRQPYLVFRPLRLESKRNNRHIFPVDYKPVVKNASVENVAPGSGVSKEQLSKAVSILEGSYFRLGGVGEETFCPRHLDPIQGLFWALSFVNEYLFQKTLSGTGFDPGIYMLCT